MIACRLENDSRKFELLLTLTVLVAITVSCVPMSAQNPPQSVGWKGANNVIAEQMWGNGTSRNYTGAQQDVNDAANAGIRWSRFVVYPAPDNVCTDQEMQHLVAMQRASGVNIMLDIQRLASSGRNCSGAAVTQTLYDPVNNPSDAQYTSWLANMVNQYKPYIHYYELGNEENGTGDWKLVDEPTPTRDAPVGGCTTTANYRNGVANYVQFLKDTYNTIKANDPTAKVILGGPSDWGVHGLHGAASLWGLPHQCGVQWLPQLIIARAVVPDPLGCVALPLQQHRYLDHGDRILQQKGQSDVDVTSASS